MSTVGLYEPGSSPLHRLGAGWKLLALLVFAVLLFALAAPIPLLVLLGAVVVGYALARLRARRCWQATRFVVPMVAVVFLVQWWMLDLGSAAVVSLRLLAAIGAANLFTLTTKVGDLITAVQRGLRPLRRVGARPERVGLLIGLTMRAIASLSSIASETREAQRARGAERSVSAFAVPFLVRTLRHADELGEALAARGVED